jgi:hypothetical protein
MYYCIVTWQNANVTLLRKAHNNTQQYASKAEHAQWRNENICKSTFGNKMLRQMCNLCCYWLFNHAVSFTEVSKIQWDYKVMHGEI